MDLIVRTDLQHAATVVHLAGPLTAGTAPILKKALVELFSTDATKIVIDLSATTRCDSAGVALIAGAAAVALERGGELRLAAPSAAVCSGLHDRGLMARIPTFVTVAGAVRADMLDLISTPEREPRSWAVSAAHALAVTRASARHQDTRSRANGARWQRPG